MKNINNDHIPLSDNLLYNKNTQKNNKDDTTKKKNVGESEKNDNTREK